MDGNRRQRLRLSCPGTAGGVAVEATYLDSGAAGPVVTLLAGVHGNELAGVVALRRLCADPPALIRGRLRVVPICHEAAFAADMRESPLDGKNLAREFPGSAAGSPTEQAAFLIDTQLIEGSDVLLDLHTSSPEADMPFFAGCFDDRRSPECARAVALCYAFGAGIVWTHPSTGHGRTLTSAHARGIPAVYVESPNGGTLNEAVLAAYLDGVLRVLGHLGMIASEDVPGPVPCTLALEGNGDIDRASVAKRAGLFVAVKALLDPVEEGDLIGYIEDEGGEPREEFRAERSGVITTLRRRSRVRRGDPLGEVAFVREAS